MNCETFREILADFLADFLAGELDQAQHTAAREHVDACAECREQTRGLQAAAAAVESTIPTVEEAERRTASLTLPAIPAPAHRTLRLAPILRYAAVVLLAFGAGYLSRGGSGPSDPAAGDKTGDPGVLNPQFVQGLERAASRYPASSGFSKALLALAKP